MNIAQAFARDPGIAQFVIDEGVKFVTTSAGSPERYTAEFMEAAVPLTGQVAGRIDSVKPVAQILAQIREEFFAVLGSLSRDYPR